MSDLDPDQLVDAADLDWASPSALVRYMAPSGDKTRTVDGFSEPMAEGSLAEVLRFYLGLNDWVQRQAKLLIHGRGNVDGAAIADMTQRADFPG